MSRLTVDVAGVVKGGGRRRWLSPLCELVDKSQLPHFIPGGAVPSGMPGLPTDGKAAQVCVCERERESVCVCVYWLLGSVVCRREILV